MPILYPSLVVNFRLRFDEAFNVSEQPAPTSTSSQAGAAPTFGRPTVRPLILEQPVQVPLAPADRLSIVTNRLPKSGTVELPAYRQAGKFNLVFDYRDLPIDPRILRACGLEVHLGTVDPADFATGMVSTDGNGRRVSILRTTDAGGFPREDTLLLVGTVDTWHVAHSGRGSELTIEGRDVRGILLDSPADPKLFTNLDLSKPIDDVVRQILSKHPFGGRIIVEVSPDDWDTNPLPSPADKNGLTRVRKNADGQGANSKPAGNVDQINYWDLITRYCFLVGAIPYFVGQKLRIRPSRSIFDQQKAGFDPRIKTPFAGGRTRVSPGDQPAEFSVRRMVYGRDVEELTFERKYTGVKARVIECISVDTSGKNRGDQKLISARWPDNLPKTNSAGKPLKQRIVAKVSNAKTTSVAPSGAASSEDVLRIPVPGINDVNKLREIAKDLFEEIGRGEMGGSFKTRNLASFLVPTEATDKLAWNRDPDLTRLRPGDGVELRVDTRELRSVAPLASAYTDTLRASFDEAVADLRQRLGSGNDVGDEDLARAIVSTARGSIIELSKFFRVANVKFDWSKDSGVVIAADFQNYIEVRSGVTPSSGENILPPVQKTSGS